MRQAFEVRNLKAFRESYPEGRNVVVTPNGPPPFTKNIQGIPVTFARLQDAW